MRPCRVAVAASEAARRPRPGPRPLRSSTGRSARDDVDVKRLAVALADPRGERAEVQRERAARERRDARERAGRSQGHRDEPLGIGAVEERRRLREGLVPGEHRLEQGDAVGALRQAHGGEHPPARGHSVETGIDGVDADPPQRREQAADAAIQRLLGAEVRGRARDERGAMREREGDQSEPAAGGDRATPGPATPAVGRHRPAWLPVKGAEREHVACERRHVEACLASTRSAEQSAFARTLLTREGGVGAAQPERRDATRAQRLTGAREDRSRSARGRSRRCGSRGPRSREAPPSCCPASP